MTTPLEKLQRLQQLIHTLELPSVPPSLSLRAQEAMQETRAILKSVSLPPDALVGVMDADAWAAHAAEVKPDDYDTLRAWFEGALLAGYSAGRDSLPSPQALPECVRVLRLILVGIGSGAVKAKPVMYGDEVKRPLEEVIVNAINQAGAP